MTVRGMTSPCQLLDQVCNSNKVDDNAEAGTFNPPFAL